MSTSTTLPQPVASQNHDRQDQADAAMSDPDGLPNGHHIAPESTTSEAPATNNVAVQVAAVDEDAMDTTPDNGQGLVLPTASADTSDAVVAPSSPAP